MLARFRANNCSNWARRHRKPHGDVRHEIEALTGIAARTWTMVATVKEVA
jgi:hypothetical protein